MSHSIDPQAKKSTPNIPLYASRLREARQNQGLSIEEASTQAAINKMTLLRYETGDIRTIAPERLDRLAKLYQTTPAYLCGISPTQEFMSDTGLHIVPFTADPPTRLGRRLQSCLDFLAENGDSPSR